MDRNQAIAKLIAYALEKQLIQPEEKNWAVNTLLEMLELDGCALPEIPVGEQIDLPAVLDALLDDAYERGVLKENSIVYRDLFDTRLMGALTPRPAQVIEKFNTLYRQSPKEATDWYYQFSQDTNYIRRDRIARDVQWKTMTEYGELDITINLSKPEKDPKAIAAARNLPASNYPRCQLCAENEGYAGRVNHPARQNHRIVPITINGSPWFLQYSPYVYYNEHCICLNREHVPMKIDRACFGKLLDFVRQFPHYFVGSNADLPIVGGSILAHDHFQGGHYTFAMEKAPVETPVCFAGFDDVQAGIVKWPMSVIRGECYELDLVLRNNLTTEEHPLGLYHPHAELHHIKKENIGLIEVMGLAVLPARLKAELAAVAEKLADGSDLRADELTASHADWAEAFAKNYTITKDNAMEIVQKETGLVFAKVLEHAGVYKRTPEGKEAFLRFIEQI